MNHDKKTLKMNDRTFRLVLSAVMIALATVLSILKVFQMPLGGAVTMGSMLPILITGYKYGPKWGLLTGFTFSIIQFILGGGLYGFSGMTWQGVIGSAFLDYFIAFSVLGLAGIYGRGFAKFILGIITAVALRFISHVISGCVIFYAYAFDTGTFPAYLKFLRGHIFLYSVIYNAFYLLPDLLLCLIIGSIIYFPLKKFIEPDNLSRASLKINF
jgi:thiamine transporter